MLKFFMLALVTVAIVACGGPPETVVPDRLYPPRPTPIPTATPEPTPTPTPEPTPTPTPIPMPTLRVLTTPTPTIEPTATPAPTPEIIAIPTIQWPYFKPTMTPAPTATPPAPTPTVSRYAPVGPGSSGSNLPETYAIKGLSYTNGPRIDDNDMLHITAVLENQSLEPTSIQVWQFPEQWRRNCPTDKPIAFAAPSRSGIEWYNWLQCVEEGIRPFSQVIEVPWVEIEHWQYSKRFKGTSVVEQSKPTYWDWRIEVDLGDYEVQKLWVLHPIGYLVVIHSGDTLMAKAWVDYDF